jgi:adenosine deaminase
VSLGVYRQAEDVPLRTLVDAGATVALGADDPLLFGSRLADQYRSARDVHGFDDEALAELARGSIRASRAGDATRARLLAGVDAWLATPADAPSPGPADLRASGPADSPVSGPADLRASGPADSAASGQGNGAPSRPADGAVSGQGASATQARAR